MKQIKKQNAGITLIALSITIIVMILLATITLYVTLGQDGIIAKAQNAGKEYKQSEVNEQKDLADLYSSMMIATNDSSQITISVQELKELMQEEIKKANMGTSPSGTVISFMGNKAPEGYLSCDGTVYNIADYSSLAEHIKTEFGSYNYFGGDGTTTFAVPDLRGEFLRGTGTASRNTGAGAAVGVHQTATNHSMMGVYTITNGSNTWIGGYGDGLGTNYNRNQDMSYGSSKGFVNSANNTTFVNTASAYIGKPTYYTSRPTNTSVLYCIKY